MPWLLSESGAFMIVHKEFGDGSRSAAKQGIVLLRSTGREPEAVPTQMNADSLLHLRRCARREAGQEYEEWIRSKFPNGISVVTLNKPQ